MGKALEAFVKRIATVLPPHGSQKLFCEKVGVSTTTIYAWLKGSPPALDIVEKVAEYMGISPWDLIKPEDESFFTLGPRESALIKLWRELPDVSKDSVEQLATLLAMSRRKP